jgi:UDP-sugar transporter A1/2/3
MDGITPAVWLVIALKSLNGILIPATLKYAGNLVYLYAKPTSIVLTALATAVYSSTLPPASFCAGSALVIWSMANFKK